MSLATLQALQHQLSLTVDAAQQHIKAATFLDTSAPCSQEASERFHELAAEIESVQTELQALVAAVVTQTRQNRVAIPTETLELTTETIDPMDVETETEDEAVQANSEKQDIDQGRNPPSPEEVATRLQHFVLKTGEASATLEAGMRRNKSHVALTACRKVTDNLFQLMVSKVPINEAAACLFRDTAGKLATILADDQVAGNMRGMCVVHLVKKLGNVLELADTLTGIPAALSDAVLRSTRLKLKKYAETHSEDLLTMMEKTVLPIQKKGKLTGRRVEGPVKKLIVDFQQEMNRYKHFQMIDVPQRSEERWKVFKEVAEALAKWIGLTSMTATPPNQLKSMLRAAKRFNQEFPDRVPVLLLRNVGMRLRICRRRHKPAKKSKTPGKPRWTHNVIAQFQTRALILANSAALIMPGRTKSLVPSSQYVDLGPWSFALWWVIILAVHLVAFGYNAAYTVFYYELQKTYMYMTFEYFGIGMTAEHHHFIANTNAVMAALHGLCVFLMVGGSIWMRELAFSPWPQGVETVTSSANKRESLKKAVVNRAGNDKTATRLMSAKFRTVRMYSKVWGRQGVLGVNGGNFHAILVARELVETALQTQQTYRMSWYLPRWLLNRFYLCLLVLNCWSSVFAYSLLFKKNEARRRFACLLCDCILDLISCMGVPLIVVLSYVDQYNARITGFDMERCRTVFSFGLISTTTSLKELLRLVPSGSEKRIACAPDNPQKPIKVGGGSYDEAGLRSRSGRMMLHSVHLLFAAWGVLLLGLHIQASLQPKLSQYTLQVHPWAVSKPACYLAVLDCHRLGISGEMDEVKTKWSEFDRSSVVTLVMRHCPALEVPDMITEFHQTSGIKVYNSTIDSWGFSAAITNTNHPELGFFFMIRVNVTDGVLPPGLHDADFPNNLYDIEICYSNLRELPDDLDSIWMIGTMIYIEYSQLSNPITELPPEIFEVPDMLYLGIGSTLINELPRNVTNLSPLLSFIYITDTNVSFFWPWIDPLVESKLNMPRPLLMGGSTYCAELENLTSGEATSFSVLPSPEYSTMLMDPSEENRDVVLHTVNCEIAYAAAFYPIALEDANSAIA
ncbi:hypothetical protein F444_19632 [Phytophthora nicotianae P1976]|nr:hypothetical protein F444_19632 [Phytophthora nicotianae P1976]